MKLFGPDPALAAIAASLKTLVELYSLDLRARGLTVETLSGEGEVLETSDEWILEQERLENVRRTLGLAPNYPIGAAIPEAGKEKDLLRESYDPEPALEGQEGLVGGGGPVASWGFGPEHAENPEE